MKNFVAPSTSFRTARSIAVRVAIFAVVSNLSAATFAAVTWPTVANLPVISNTQTTDPNMVLTLDNSGSMGQGFMPDSVCLSGNNRRFSSAAFNGMAYDPSETYQLPLKSDGTILSTNFSNAYVNGFNPSSGTRNLGSGYQPTGVNFSVSSVSTLDSDYDTYLSSYRSLGLTTTGICDIAQTPSPNWYRPIYFDNPAPDFTSAQRTVGVAAYYYVYETTLSGCTRILTNEACYRKVGVNSSSGPGGIDERQNFAVWYSFYRTRILSAMSSLSVSLRKIPSNYRFAFQNLGNCALPVNSATCTVANAIAPFTAARMQSTLAWVQSQTSLSNGTPTRSAMQRAGEYFKATGASSPRAFNIGVSDPPVLGCRRNYHVMVTDGVWNGDSSLAIGNTDGTARTLGNGTTSYAPLAPYAGASGDSNSLADIAFNYWATDLQPGVANAVTPIYNDTTGTATQQFWNAKNNPATWQHMVNFTIGLGLSQTLTTASRPAWGGDTFSGDYPALAAGTLQWPTTGQNAEGNVADLWHAAINSRGEFFSADNPALLNAAFDRILAIVAAADGTSGQIGASGSRLVAGGKYYTTSYTTGPWAGTLTATNVNGDGSAGTEAWNTDTTLISDAPTRNIFTANAPLSGSTTSLGGRAFLWAGTAFTSTEKTSYFNNSLPVFNFIRGDRSQESPAGTLRKRNTVVGEIVASDILVTGKTDYGYANAGLTCTNYSDYVARKRETVFVGSGAGMLHAFDGATGAEIFAYVPYGVLPQIQNTASSSFARVPLVESSLTMHDVCSGTTWKTILVGTLGAGGRSVFALDVSSVVAPTGGTSSFSTSNVLWELNDVKLGKGIPTPVIGRAKNGSAWQVFVGNGYGSSDGLGYLFVVNALTGAYATTALSNAPSGLNGVSSPTLLEYSRAAVETVYAGDYQGNVWKFVQSATGAWVQSGTGAFFAGKSDFSQPISAKIALTQHPAGGIMLVFGTGKLFEDADKSTTASQSLYGLRDIGSAVTRSALVQQVITTTSLSGRTVRTLTQNPVDLTQKSGWYIDLPVGTGAAAAERTLTQPLIDGIGALFLTLGLSNNQEACLTGGVNYLMEVNAFTGGRRATPTLDVNGNGTASSVGGIAVSGVQLEGVASIKQAILVTVPVLRNATYRASTPPPAAKGGDGQPPICDANGNNCQCLPNLYLNGGVCKPSRCKEGSSTYLSGSSAVCRLNNLPLTWTQQVK